MFILNLIVTLVSMYFAKQAYDEYRLGHGMFWAGLLGWNIHTLLYSL